MSCAYVLYGRKDQVKNTTETSMMKLPGDHANANASWLLTKIGFRETKPLGWFGSLTGCTNRLVD